MSIVRKKEENEIVNMKFKVLRKAKVIKIFLEISVFMKVKYLLKEYNKLSLFH